MPPEVAPTVFDPRTGAVRPLRVTERAEAGRSGTPREQAPAPERHPRIVRLADVEPEEVSWLWEPYIPRGKLTLLEGDPGVGKTWFALQLAANVSLGHPFPGVDGRPGERREPDSVVYLTAEDGLADTLRPRLDAMGADVSRIYVIDGWTGTDPETGQEITGAVTLADLDLLEKVLDEIGPALLIVDPLQAYLGASVDMHRANETRPVLSGLAKLAEAYGCAVVAIRHLSKSPKDRAIYRGLGSIDLAAAARSILLVGADPDDDTGRRRVMAHVKSSLAEKGPSLAYSIRGGAFYWEGVVETSPEALLAPDLADENERRALQEAVAFLSELLADGPVPAREVQRAYEQAGLSRTTIFRAKRQLGIQVKKEGTTWLWCPPTQRMEQMEHLEQLARKPASDKAFQVFHDRNFHGTVGTLDGTVDGQVFHDRNFLGTLENPCGTSDSGSSVPSVPSVPSRVHMNPLPGRCGACGGTAWWRRAGGKWVCEACHPPASPEIVAERVEVTQ